jgi:hypothetical protein
MPPLYFSAIQTDYSFLSSTFTTLEKGLFRIVQAQIQQQSDAAVSRWPVLLLINFGS